MVGSETPSPGVYPFRVYKFDKSSHYFRDGMVIESTTVTLEWADLSEIPKISSVSFTVPGDSPFPLGTELEMTLTPKAGEVKG